MKRVLPRWRSSTRRVNTSTRSTFSSISTEQRKGGQFFLNEQKHFDIMIIEKINSKFMKNRSMLRSLQNYLIQFNKIKSSLKNQTSPRKHKHTRLARSLRFIAYPEKVRWKNIWFLGRKWLLRASHDQKWYQKHMIRKVELQTIYYSNREKARGCRWKLKKKWLPKPQEQLQRAIIMIKTQKLEHVLSYSLHSKV